MKRKINSACVSLDCDEVRRLTKCPEACLACKKFDAKTRICSAASLWIEFPMFELAGDYNQPDFTNSDVIELSSR